MATKNFTFNGVRNDRLYQLSGVQRTPFAQPNNNLLHVPGKAGAFITSTEINEHYIRIPVGVHVDGYYDEQRVFEELANWLITDEPVPLMLDEEPDRIYYAKLDTSFEDLERFSRTRRGTIVFLCADPYKYSHQHVVEFEDNTVTVTNNGSVETEPIFEFEIQEDITELSYECNGERMAIGRPDDVEVPKHQSAQIVWRDNGSDISKWGEQGINSPPTHNPSGVFASNGNQIFVANYGSYSGDGPHGPVVRSDLDYPLMDFELRLNLRFIVQTIDRCGRFEMHLLAANGSLLGKVSLKSVSPNSNRILAEIRVGDNERGTFILKTEELSDSANYIRNYFWGRLTIKRDRNKWSGWVSEIDDDDNFSRPIHAENYTDTNEQFSQPLAAVQLLAAKFGDHREVSQMYMHYGLIYERHIPPPETIPVLASEGDTITVDHTRGVIYVNDEPATHLKQISGTYFSLASGTNTININQSSVKGRVKWQDRYR